MQVHERTTKEQDLLNGILARGDVKQIVIGPGKPVYEPPCSCPECEDHFYLKGEQEEKECFCYTRKLRDEEAKAFLARKVEDIRTAHAHVKRVVELHGDTILKAWRKRSPAKRASLLQELEPKIAERKGLVADLTVAGFDSNSDWSASYIPPCPVSRPRNAYEEPGDLHRSHQRSSVQSA